MIPYGLPIYGAENPGALFGYNLSLSPDGSTIAVAMCYFESDRGVFVCCSFGRVLSYYENGNSQNSEWRPIGTSFDGDGSILSIHIFSYFVK
mgnify:CR=1 FL=1